MKKDISKIIVIFVGLTFLPEIGLHGYEPGSAQDTEALVQQVSEKMASYPDFKSWRALLISKTTKMSGRWQPKESLHIKKEVRVVDEERTEKILEALVAKKGKIKDETQKYIKKARKEKEKAERKQRKQKEKGEKEKAQDRRNFSMSFEDLFPFDEESGKNYSFSQMEDVELEGKTLHVLVSQAKEKGEKYWEGKYYIDPESLTILHIDLKPSKNPKYVKELRLQMEFAENHQGYYIFKKVKMKINAGIIIKRIRMLVEEEYTDFEVIE